MALQLFVNTRASALENALVRSATDLTPIVFPELVIGDIRDYELFFVTGLGGYESWSGSALYSPFLAIGECGNPTGGTFTLTYSGQTTSALAYNISPAALQTALEALSNLAPGDVTVSGVAGQYYQVTFGGTLAATDVSEITGNGANLTPDSVVAVDTITEGDNSPATNEVQLIQLKLNPITYQDTWTPIANGWSGTLSTRTLEAVKKLATESPIADVLQITVQDPTGYRRTYLKKDVSVYCTVIDPESVVGADKPTFATIAYVNSLALAGGVFTREAVANSSGNSNITRPSGSHYHTALITVSGSAGTRTFSILTTNTPAAGDRIRLYFLNPATASIVLEVRNATSGGTLLKTKTTDATGRDFPVDLAYSGSAWELVGDTADVMSTDQNLAGLATLRTARANLATLFASYSDKSANFTVTTGEDGRLFRVTTAASSIVATLPAASTAGSGFMLALLKVDSGTGTLATSPASETVAAQNQLMVLMSDGTTWVVLLNIGRAAATTAPLNLFSLTGLTGGGGTNLDGLVTADGRYPIGTIVVLYNTGTTELQWWQLASGTTAEDAPNGVVRPDDYATTTNEKIWLRRG